ncbi:integrase core domain-containing protein [Nocardia vulneris]|uniref:integrase core domain-containing protein n=1 Tax=Nocardia vulneris TaxID=1141657 RepID=UPI003BAF7595
MGTVYIPRGTAWNNGFVGSFNRRLRTEYLNRNHWTSLLEARVMIGDFKTEHNHRHRHSALGYLTPAEYAARCSHTHHSVACGIIRTWINNPDSKTGWIRYRGPVSCMADRNRT